MLTCGYGSRRANPGTLVFTSQHITKSSPLETRGVGGSYQGFLTSRIAKSHPEKQDHHHVGRGFAVESGVCHAETGGARPDDDLLSMGHALFRHTRVTGVGGFGAGPMAITMARRGCGGDFGSSSKRFDPRPSYAEPDFAKECFVDLLRRPFPFTHPVVSWICL